MRAILDNPVLLVVVLLLVVLLFGAKRLPDAARSIGRSMRIFKSEVKEMKDDGKPAPGSSAASGPSSATSSASSSASSARDPDVGPPRPLEGRVVDDEVHRDSQRHSA